MTNNKYLAWTSFSLFFLSAGLLLLLVLASPFLSAYIENPIQIIYGIGAFSLLATIMGFLSFKAQQAKVGAFGGLVLLLLVLFVIPVRVESTASTPQPEVVFQKQAGQTGIAEIDTVIDAVLAGDQSQILQLLQFSKLACTETDGLGGPPKCKETEVEGTEVEAFPILGSEGHHLRHSDLDNWKGIPATAVYAVYKVSPQAYSNDFYPAGEYAIVFRTEQENLLVTLQVTNGKIIRIDDKFGNPAVIDLEREASAVIVEPQD